MSIGCVKSSMGKVMAAVAYITPEILKWARERCGFSDRQMAEKLNVKTEAVQAWETGEERPAMGNARNFAKKTYIPFGYLYLNSPPDLSLPVADFRSGWDSSRNVVEEVHLYDLVKSMLYKKEWYEDYLMRMGSNVNSGLFQGSFSNDDNSHDIAKSITDYLNLHIRNEEKGRGKPSSFWNRFKAKVIDANIWLMQTSVVDSNTSRKISSRTSRGLALKSGRYPIIWVNSGLQDAPKIFTLAHELAHIWIGTEGISDHGEESDSANQIEKLCDEVASEVLVPEQSIRKMWELSKSPEENVERLYEYYGVSRFVVARKSYHADIIERSEHTKLNRTLREKAHVFVQQGNKEKEGTPSFYNTLIARNGRGFTEAVIDEVENNKIFLTDACRLLGFNSPSTIEGVSNYLRGNRQNVSS